MQVHVSGRTSSARHAAPVDSELIAGNSSLPGAIDSNDCDDKTEKGHCSLFQVNTNCNTLFPSQ